MNSLLFMGKKLSVKEKIELVKRNTYEIIGEEDLEKLFKKKQNKPSVYLGTAPTGRPHVGYFVWALKIADLLRAGFHVKILLADLHAALDNVPWKVLEERYNYYSKVIPLMVEAIGVDTEELEFIKGSDFQLKSEYMFELLQLTSFVSVHDSNKAGSEVVKQSDNPKVAGLLYPLMQVLDEQYLNVDMQLGGVDQRKIMVLARENLPKLGYDSRIEMMFPLVPGLIGKKMSSSDNKGKIDLLDDPKTVVKKLKGAEMVAGNSNNGVMAFLKYVLMTIKKDKGEKFIVKRPEKFGGNLTYFNYNEIEKDFIEKKLHPLDLKNAVAESLNELLSILQKKKTSIEKIAKKAYS